MSARDLESPQEISKKVGETLGHQLEGTGYSLAEMIEIPRNGSRIVRLRTLEEALDELDRAPGEESVCYLIRIRHASPRGEKSEVAPGGDPLLEQLMGDTFSQLEEPESDKPKLDGIYLPNGRINARYLLDNASILVASSEHALARNIYETLLRTGEQKGAAHLGLGICAAAEGKLEVATRHFEESIAYQPCLEAYQRLAAIQIKAGKDASAAESLERASTLPSLSDRNRGGLHRLAGNCWLRCAQSKKAEERFLRAIELGDGNDTVWTNLGMLALDRGDAAGAKARFGEAVARNPRNDKALCGLGNCALSEGDRAAAHDSFARALDANPKNATALFQLVKCAFDLKNYATAAGKLERYTKLAPLNANLLYSLAGLQFHLGRFQEASRSARKAIELKTGHSGANELLKLIEQYDRSHPPKPVKEDEA